MDDNQDLIRRSGFHFEWKNDCPENISSNDEFMSMRGWQLNAFKKLKAAPYMILNAPMGSGKSWMMCLLSAFKMKEDSSLRTIIIVPQTIIAPGFVEAKIIMPDIEKLHWKIKHNLCSDRLKKDTINYFIRWLENPSKFFADRTIICTHATLVAAYKKLKAQNRLFLLTNILLWIDEAHHVKNIAAEGLDGVVLNNAIGELVTYFLKDGSSNLQVGLTTASFFRGDRATLLTDSMGMKFERFNLPYDEYLGSMKYLKSFSFDFLLSGPNYTKGIQQLLKSRRGKDIIYIPHPISQYSTGNKHQEVADIISLYGDIISMTEEGLIITSGENGEHKILDLVSENQRAQKKNYLDNPILKEQRNSLDAIITLGMFKEGANWIHANRVIIAGARASLVDVIQMVGRPLRDAEGKSHVEVIQLLPFSLDQRDKEVLCENLNNYIKAIYASLILENILNPITIKAIQKVEKENSDEHKSKEDRKTNWLNHVLPDDAKQLSLIEDVSNHLVDIINNNPEANNNTYALHEKYKKIIPEILESHNIHEYKEEVAKQIWGTLVRRSMQMQGLAVEDIDFNIVHETQPLDFLLRYTSGACDVDTFKKLRDAIQLSRAAMKPFEESRDYARSLALKTQIEWYNHTKTNELPIGIPKAPQIVYSEKGWKGWGDFLGTGVIASQNRIFRPYEEARKFADVLKFTAKAEWYEWAKTNNRPQDIPADPQAAYAKSGWNGWGDFLGTGTIAPQNRKFKSFEEAKKYVQGIDLKGIKEYHEFLKLPSSPKDLPTNPNKIYAQNGWKSNGDFFGTGNIAKMKREFRPFEEARKLVRSLGFKNMQEYRAWTKTSSRPQDIPVYPNETYKDKGWKNVADWLGKIKK